MSLLAIFKVSMNRGGVQLIPTTSQLCIRALLSKDALCAIRIDPLIKRRKLGKISQINGAFVTISSEIPVTCLSKSLIEHSGLTSELKVWSEISNPDIITAPSSIISRVLVMGLRVVSTSMEAYLASLMGVSRILSGNLIL